MELLVAIAGTLLAYVAVHRQVNGGVRRAWFHVRGRFLDARGRRPRDTGRVHGRPVFTLGCFPYEPLIRWNRDRADESLLEFEGPWIKLMRDVADILEIEMELQPISARDFENTKDIQADFVVGLFWTESRAKYFDFSVPVHRIRLQGICRRSLGTITKERLVSGELQVVVQPGEVGWEYALDQLAPLVRMGKVMEFPSQATFEISAMLFNKGYDVAICDEVSCIRFLQDASNRRTFKLAFEWPMPSYKACIAVQKRLDWDIETLDAALRKARNSPGFTAYENIWLSGDFGRVVEKCHLDP
jgi:hypothetical protein